jgi:hypothetical protein
MIKNSYLQRFKFILINDCCVYNAKFLEAMMVLFFTLKLVEKISFNMQRIKKLKL